MATTDNRAAGTIDVSLKPNDSTKPPVNRRSHMEMLQLKMIINKLSDIKQRFGSSRIELDNEICEEDIHASRKLLSGIARNGGAQQGKKKLKSKFKTSTV